MEAFIILRRHLTVDWTLDQKANCMLGAKFLIRETLLQENENKRIYISWRRYWYLQGSKRIKPMF